MAAGGDDKYKWEDSPGLAHHCGVCKRPLGNPSALQSCIGIHVEPCRRYHQQLHFIKKSHDCSSCHIGVEMHRKRHREILTLVHLVNKDHSKAVSSAPSEVVTQPATPSKVSGESRKERKQLRKSAANSNRIPTTEILTEAKYVFVSEALYGKTTWGKSGSGLADERTIGEDSRATEAKFASTPGEGKRPEKADSGRKKTRKAGSAPITSDPLVGVDPQIFERLGVRLAGSDKWPKDRRDDLKRLATLIAQDLEITEREEQEFEMRKAGFFRFVNKKTVTILDKLHEAFSWSTGVVKKPTSQ